MHRFRHWEYPDQAERKHGQAHVFKAKKVGDESGKEYALKRFPGADHKHREDFMKSRLVIAGRLMADPDSLLANHIMPVVDCGNHDGWFFEVSEWVSESSLDNYLASNTPDPDGLEAFLRQVASQVTCALAYVHKTLDVTHRDVKASNLLVIRNDPFTLALTDFGLAGNSVTPGATQMARDNLIAPPENWNQASFDYYQLGLLLLDLASRIQEGKALIREGVQDEVVKWLINGVGARKVIDSGAFAGLIHRLIPWSLRGLVAHLMAYEPTSRWGRDDVLKALTSQVPQRFDPYVIGEPTGDQRFPSLYLLAEEGMRNALERNKEDREWLCNIDLPRFSAFRWIQTHGTCPAGRDSQTKVADELEKAFESLRADKRGDTLDRVWQACLLLDPLHPINIGGRSFYTYQDVCDWLGDDSQATESTVQAVAQATRRRMNSLSLLERWLQMTQITPSFAIDGYQAVEESADKATETLDLLRRLLDSLDRSPYCQGISVRSRPGEVAAAPPRNPAALRYLAARYAFARADERLLSLSSLDGPQFPQILPEWVIGRAETVETFRAAGEISLWLEAVLPNDRRDTLGLSSCFAHSAMQPVLTWLLAMELAYHVELESSRTAKVVEGMKLWIQAVDLRIDEGWYAEGGVIDKLRQAKSPEIRGFCERATACWRVARDHARSCPHFRSENLSSWIVRQAMFPDLPLWVSDTRSVGTTEELACWLMSNPESGSSLRATGRPQLWCYLRSGCPAVKSPTKMTAGRPVPAPVDPWDRACFAEQSRHEQTTLLAHLIDSEAKGPNLRVKITRGANVIVDCLAQNLPDSIDLGTVQHRDERAEIEIELSNADGGWMCGGVQGRGWLSKVAAAGKSLELASKKSSPGPIKDTDIIFTGNKADFYLPLDSRGHDHSGALTVHYNRDGGSEETEIPIHLHYRVAVDYRQITRNTWIGAVVCAVLFGLLGWRFVSIQQQSVMLIDNGGELLPLSEGQQRNDSGVARVVRTFPGSEIWLRDRLEQGSERHPRLGPVAGPQGAVVEQFNQQALSGLIALLLFVSVIALGLFFWMDRERRT